MTDKTGAPDKAGAPAGGKILEVHTAGNVLEQHHQHVVPLIEGQVRACAIAEFDSLEKAEHAVRALPNADFPQHQISVVLAHPQDRFGLPADRKFGDESARDSAIGAGLGGVLGYLGGAMVALVTGLGTVFLIGPFAGLFACATLGALVGALEGLGVHHDHLSRYQRSLKDGKVLVIAHGDRSETEKAGRILTESGASDVHIHARTISNKRD